MSDFLNYLALNRQGIIVLFFCILGLGMLVHYAMWIFSLGRFTRTSVRPPRERLNFVLADAAIKIINDFRHFLALLILVVFSAVLGYAVVKGGTDVNGIKDSLQAVMATLGGLVGSIIGYYFGESAVRSNINPNPNPVVNQPDASAGASGTPIQNPDINPEEVEDIETAPPPGN